MWKLGHSFKEIKRMNLEDVSSVVGVLTGESRGEEKLRKTRKNLGG